MSIFGKADNRDLLNLFEAAIRDAHYGYRTEERLREACGKARVEYQPGCDLVDGLRLELERRLNE